MDRVERGIVSLTVRLVERVESLVLGVELVKIVKKIRDSLKSRFANRMEVYGFQRVRELASRAVKWGHETSEEWISDLGFIKYVTMMDMNTPSGWGLLYG